jgi:hypothetical protein
LFGTVQARNGASDLRQPATSRSTRWSIGRWARGGNRQSASVSGSGDRGTHQAVQFPARTGGACGVVAAAHECFKLAATLTALEFKQRHRTFPGGCRNQATFGNQNDSPAGA